MFIHKTKRKICKCVEEWRYECKKNKTVHIAYLCWPWIICEIDVCL